MIARVTMAAVVLLAGALATTGCESSQDRSARLRKQGNTLLKGGTRTVVIRSNPEVKVLGTVAIQDRNGSAAVVSLRNTSAHTWLNVPVDIDVRGANGRSIFRNNAVGIENSLTGPSLLAPHADMAWVNDQVAAAGAPKAVVAKVGIGTSPPAVPPKIDVTPPHQEIDPTSGLSAVGMVTNRSSIPQRKLVLYCVARRNGRIVAAGRGGIDVLKPHKPTRYTIFFIGNPRGAALTVAAPPTTFS